VPHTFSADAAVGDVVEIGTVPAIVAAAVDYSEQPIGTVDFGGMWDVPQVAGVITAGDAVYWDSDGSPYGGTTSSGCATGTAGSNNLMGLAAPTQPNGTTATTATDSYVRVIMTAAKRTATIAGSVTANDITGSDTGLGIAGKAGSSSAGGTVDIAGGAGSTGAGGAVSMTGGAGDAAAGGAASVVGGAGGASQVGGAVALTGGAPASGNAAGGTAAVTGGAGVGTGAGGAASITGGASGNGATGNGGAVTVVGGAGTSTAGVGGAVTITSGASAGSSGTAGAVAIDCGAASGGTAGAITIGGTNAGSITLGKMPIIPSATVAATGAAQANAAAIASGFTLVTAADATTGVKLPAAAAGLVCIIKNADADNAVLKVWPNTADAINALSANASLDMAAKTSAVLVAYNATTWYSIPLLPS
jgi:hypothetical protein